MYEWGRLGVEEPVPLVVGSTLCWEASAVAGVAVVVEATTGGLTVAVVGVGVIDVVGVGVVVGAVVGCAEVTVGPATTVAVVVAAGPAYLVDS